MFVNILFIDLLREHARYKSATRCNALTLDPTSCNDYCGIKARCLCIIKLSVPGLFFISLLLHTKLRPSRENWVMGACVRRRTLCNSILQCSLFCISLFLVTYNLIKMEITQDSSKIYLEILLLSLRQQYLASVCDDTERNDSEYRRRLDGSDKEKISFESSRRSIIKHSYPREWIERSINIRSYHMSSTIRV